MRIRPEHPGDEAAIHDLTVEAFEPMPFSNGTEAPIINKLRQDQDLIVSLVAEEADAIIGHIAFSPVTINDQHNGWYGLGPVSVRPDRQRQGIGRQLIEVGLAQIKDLGAAGCALIGNPDYYSRFGFVSDGGLVYGDVPPQFVQWVSFRGESTKGVLKFAPAFDVEA